MSTTPSPCHDIDDGLREQFGHGSTVDRRVRHPWRCRVNVQRSRSGAGRSNRSSPVRASAPATVRSALPAATNVRHPPRDGWVQKYTPARRTNMPRDASSAVVRTSGRPLPGPRIPCAGSRARRGRCLATPPRHSSAGSRTSCRPTRQRPRPGEVRPRSRQRRLKYAPALLARREQGERERWQHLPGYGTIPARAQTHAHRRLGLPRRGVPRLPKHLPDRSSTSARRADAKRSTPAPVGLSALLPSENSAPHCPARKTVESATGACARAETMGRTRPRATSPMTRPSRIDS
jgi:hypothetical protein